MTSRIKLTPKRKELLRSLPKHSLYLDFPDRVQINILARSGYVVLNAAAGDLPGMYVRSPLGDAAIAST